MKNIIGIFSLGVILILGSCNCSTKQANKSCAADSATCCKSKITYNVLTDQEKTEGWQLLFDGDTIDQWHGFNGEDVSQGWIIEDGCLKAQGHGADIGGSIVTSREFENFELYLEWRIGHGGNSGILYGVIEDPKYKAPYYTGPEYQLLDDIGFPDKLEEWQLAGANYAMYTADKSKKKLQMVGGPEFNTSKLIINGTHVEYWLNGEKIVEFERWTEDWNKRKAEGKWKDFPDYGMAKKGKISLQDHGSFIWFRNIKIREL